MAIKNPIKSVYSRLSDLGFNPKFVREYVLPNWWNDEIANDEVGLLEGLFIISRNLGIDFQSLKNAETALSFDKASSRYYKGPIVRNEAPALVAIAERVAQTALLGVGEAFRSIDESAVDVRQAILREEGDWVSFQNLVSYCWSVGIPVLHLKKFPTNAKKLRGVAVSVEQRYAIVLGQQFASPARHLFTLAHELGHIILNHLIQSSLLIDTEAEVRFNERTEAEANRFARSLILGNHDFSEYYGQQYSDDQLLKTANELSKFFQVDPAYLILNHGNSLNSHKQSMKLLSYRVEAGLDAGNIVNVEMINWLDMDEIPSDSKQFLLNMTGASELS